MGVISEWDTSNMTDEGVKDYVNTVFGEILKSKSKNDLQKIESQFDKKVQIDDEKYPKIEFQIGASEIVKLQKEGVLDGDFNLMKDASFAMNDPLTKLLYSIIWKNGDLKKINHIARGIYDIDEEEGRPNKAYVFYQFGKYLTKNVGQPIIDQHVIRAYGIYSSDKSGGTEKERKLGLLKKVHEPIIKGYIDWLKSDALKPELKSVDDYTYWIDRILFATGKQVKLK